MSAQIAETLLANLHVTIGQNSFFIILSKKLSTLLILYW